MTGKIDTASSRFRLRDQQRFARVSGDWNPVHLDPIAARRTLFGDIIVHGAHILLRSIDAWASKARERSRIVSLDASFRSAIHLGTDTSFSISKSGASRIVVDVTSGGKLCAEFKFVSKPFRRDARIVIPASSPPREAPFDIAWNDVGRMSGTVPLAMDGKLVGKLFPSLSRVMRPSDVASILAVTRVIGMKCPGRRSLLSEIRVAFSPFQDKIPNLRWRVEKVDSRFSLVTQRVNAPGFSGIVSSMQRPEATIQPRIADLRNERQNEFSGQRALVVGGSRGAGEVAAKILAAGDADVRLTYHRGRADARAVVEDIRSADRNAMAFPLDIRHMADDLAHVLSGPWIPTHLYYFATPFIFSGAKGQYSPRLFIDFSAYYVSAFQEIVARLREAGAVPLFVFYPSSAAVTEIPAAMGEYAAAKAAGEITVDYLAKTCTGLFIRRVRLPRLATDQTVSMISVPNVSPAPILLDILRSMKDVSAFHESTALHVPAYLEDAAERNRRKSPVS